VSALFDAGVVGPSEDAAALAAALAARLARAAVPALLVAWTAGDGPAPVPAPATGAATRLAARLRERGLAAAPAGRLVRVRVTGREAALRAAGAAPGPAVLAVTSPRDAEADALLAQAARLLVAGEPGTALAAAALADLMRLGLPAACERAPRGGAALLARMGFPAARGAPPEAAS
jgi:hypothetical protein